MARIYEFEKDLKKDAITLLKRLFPVSMVHDTPNMPVKVGCGRKTKTREPGKSDLHCCIKGKAVYLEVKLPGKTLSKDQEKFKKQVHLAGGIFIEFHNLEELVEELRVNGLLVIN